MAIDEPTRAALARLTEREKDCLRRRLAGQTAKEMALALGVSPHAVEKRLKMARAKLGLSSSLQAARLIAAAEAADARLVPQPAALPPVATAGEVGAPSRSGPRKEIMPMLPLLALAAALLPQASAPVPPPTADGEVEEAVAYRAASPQEVRAFVADSFRTMDKDGSGYVEREEAPESGLINSPGQVGDPVGPETSITLVHGRPGRAMWVAIFDSNADGRVSPAEFAAVQTPTFRRLGVPANWRGAAAAAAAAAAAPAAAPAADHRPQR